MDPYAKNPYSMQWNFGVAKQFNNSTTMNLDYVGSGSRRLDLGGYYNVALTPGPGDPRPPTLHVYSPDLLRSQLSGAGTTTPCNSNSTAGFRADWRTRSRIPTRRASTLDLQAGTAWKGSRCRTRITTTTTGVFPGFDLTQAFSVNILYELPIGKGKRFSTGNGVADYILGGWQINTITSARSGMPYNISVPGDSANTGNTGYLRPTWSEIRISIIRPGRSTSIPPPLRHLGRSHSAILDDTCYAARRSGISIFPYSGNSHSESGARSSSGRSRSICPIRQS